MQNSADVCGIEGQLTIPAVADGKDWPIHLIGREIGAGIETVLGLKSGPQGRGSRGTEGLRRRRARRAEAWCRSARNPRAGQHALERPIVTKPGYRLSNSTHKPH